MKKMLTKASCIGMIMAFAIAFIASPAMAAGKTTHKGQKCGPGQHWSGKSGCVSK